MAQSLHKVLVVEDNEADAVVVRQRLLAIDEPKFEVEVATTLWEATNHLTWPEVPFEVILLDLGLSDSEGLETYAAVREAAPRLPIVVLTGMDDENLAIKAVRQGAQDWLHKDQAKTA